MDLWPFGHLQNLGDCHTIEDSQRVLQVNQLFPTTATAFATLCRTRHVALLDHAAGVHVVGFVLARLIPLLFRLPIFGLFRSGTSVALRPPQAAGVAQRLGSERALTDR